MHVPAPVSLCYAPLSHVTRSDVRLAKDVLTWMGLWGLQPSRGTFHAVERLNSDCRPKGTA